MLLRFLSNEESKYILTSTHARLCGTHQSGPKLADQINRLGYYWPTMVKDAMEFSKACRACQIHGDFIHQPHRLLHPFVLSWPFNAWDVVGHINPSSSLGHQYILAETDYFSKWAEVIPVKLVRAKEVVNFVRIHLIYRYGVPSKIISENALYFRNQLLVKQAEKFGFKHTFSSSYNPTSNDQVEAYKKSVL
ncbi:hypothetical protein V2J09_009152 [Rumex salicifolius]